MRETILILAAASVLFGSVGCSTPATLQQTAAPLLSPELSGAVQLGTLAPRGQELKVEEPKRWPALPKLLPKVANDHVMSEAEFPKPPRHLLQSSGAWSWGVQVKLLAQGSVPNVAQGFRARKFYPNPDPGTGPACFTLASSRYFVDVTVTGKPLEMINHGYQGHADYYSYNLFGSPVLWYPAAGTYGAAIGSIATEYTNDWGQGYFTSIIYTGYLHIPASGNYRFRWYDWWTHPQSYNMYEPRRPYLRIGKHLLVPEPPQPYQNNGGAWASTPSRDTYNLQPGLYPFEYLLFGHSNHGGYLFYQDGGTSWKRFPATAFYIGIDGNNPDLGLDFTPKFLGRGAASLSTASVITTDAYDAHFNSQWSGKISRTTYTVPSDKYLVVVGVQGRDFVNSPTRRDTFPLFVTLDNIVVDAPLEKNGLNGAQVFGPGEVVAIGAPVLKSSAETYLPDVVLSGYLVAKDVFERGGFVIPK